MISDPHGQSPDVRNLLQPQNASEDASTQCCTSRLAQAVCGCTWGCRKQLPQPQLYAHARGDADLSPTGQHTKLHSCSLLAPPSTSTQQLSMLPPFDIHQNLLLTVMIAIQQHNSTLAAQAGRHQASPRHLLTCPPRSAGGTIQPALCQDSRILQCEGPAVQHWLPPHPPRLPSTPRLRLGPCTGTQGSAQDATV